MRPAPQRLSELPVSRPRPVVVQPDSCACCGKAFVPGDHIVYIPGAVRADPDAFRFTEEQCADCDAWYPCWVTAYGCGIGVCQACNFGVTYKRR